VFSYLLAAALCFAQFDDVPGYQNFDPPNCGSFHTNRIMGTLRDQTGDPITNAQVQVFDDGSRKLLWKTKTDASGRFSVDRRWPGKLRVVFSAPGFLPENRAVTLNTRVTPGPPGARALAITLSVFKGDWIAVCPDSYSP